MVSPHRTVVEARHATASQPLSVIQRRLSHRIYGILGRDKDLEPSSHREKKEVD